MTGFIAKPCTLEDLVSGVSTALQSGDGPTTGIDTRDGGRFDPDALERLRGIGAGDGVVVRAASAFETTAAAALTLMRDAVGQGDAETLRFQAHKLKSGSASLGAVQLANLTSELEALALDGQLADAAARVEDLAREVEATTAWLAGQANRDVA